MGKLKLETVCGSLLTLCCLLPVNYVEGATHFCMPGGEISKITDHSGVIRTVYDGSTTYVNSQKCVWVIDAGSGANRAVKLSVTKSDLEWAPANSICTGYDYIEVRDGNNLNADSVVSWCGESNPYHVSTSGRYLYLSFVSNDRNIYTYTGATIEFECYEISNVLGGCPPGWYDDPDVADGGDSCFVVRNHTETWTSSQRLCNYEQANLASVKGEVEAAAITAILKIELGKTSEVDVWLGLNDIEVDGSYKWLDKSPLSTSISRWRSSPHKPDPYLNCILMRASDGKWAESFCNENDIHTLVKHMFLCQKPKVGKAELYIVPNERSKKSGKSGPSIPVIAWLIPVLFVILIAAAVTAYCGYTRCRQVDNKRTTDQRPVAQPQRDSVPLRGDAAAAPAYTAGQREIELGPMDIHDPARRSSPPPSYEASRGHPVLRVSST